ncbi:hypothetical protein Back11_12840 [Paenibacillus baekrokdamisoli]|uniref:Uncharacterized protein n=1 Tax=Paenibacillus baekrokdamisoli TaxID=1712516 RepID=A0A3G9JAB7_9BACL|nr:hypothetical protein [Paenibacillus baekrokdamisoli]MBB3070588.1 hypothetical protein [Paenibacillus baekrokdamisoli]BBH19939.1 hypothetical protein Back11_12840 [Paenibacillus baekrokdamisoli]
MPTVIRNRRTGEIACGFLRNTYDIQYYGAFWWEDNETAVKNYVSALHSKTADLEDHSSWELLDIQEERLKMFNVKLNNDTRRKLFLEKDGTLTVQKA